MQAQLVRFLLPLRPTGSASSLDSSLSSYRASGGGVGRRLFRPRYCNNSVSVIIIIWRPSLPNLLKRVLHSLQALLGKARVLATWVASDEALIRVPCLYVAVPRILVAQFITDSPVHLMNLSFFKV